MSLENMLTMTMKMVICVSIALNLKILGWSNQGWWYRGACSMHGEM